jgi:hypothetical protein
LIEEPLDTNIFEVGVLPKGIVLARKASLGSEIIIHPCVIFQNLKLVKAGIKVIIDVPSGIRVLCHQLYRCTVVKFAEEYA